MAEFNNDFNWNWANANPFQQRAASQSKLDELIRRKAANEARIEQLMAQLDEIRNTVPVNTEQDMLDLELAANRARAYDIPNAMQSLGRVDERRQSRLRAAREEAKMEQTRSMENDLKISELQKQYQQELNELANSANAPSDAAHRTNLKYLGEKIRLLGGDIPGGPVDSYKTRSDIQKDYWDNTVNTKEGRKFRDNVDATKRSQLVEDLRSIGEFAMADALQATKTPGEIADDKKAEATKKKKLKKAVDQVNNMLKDARKLEKSNDSNDVAKSVQLRRDAESIGDSLSRNYGSYVKFENGLAKYIAKD